VFVVGKRLVEHSLADSVERDGVMFAFADGRR
jgi:hypothetical protein